MIDKDRLNIIGFQPGTKAQEKSFAELVRGLFLYLFPPRGSEKIADENSRQDQNRNQDDLGDADRPEEDPESHDGLVLEKQENQKSRQHNGQDDFCFHIALLKTRATFDPRHNALLKS
jgi:hypothetical protein